jgi:NAD(P)H dehydrogenase (quinone)
LSRNRQRPCVNRFTNTLLQYSTWGHVQTLAEAEAKGIREAGGSVDLFRVPETLPQEVLTKMYAPPKDTSIPEITDPSILEQYDAFLMGIPTRYGNFPAQWRAFWDNTGKQWQSGECLEPKMISEN